MNVNLSEAIRAEMSDVGFEVRCFAQKCKAHVTLDRFYIYGRTVKKVGVFYIA